MIGEKIFFLKPKKKHEYVERKQSKTQLHLIIFSRIINQFTMHNQVSEASLR